MVRASSVVIIQEQYTEPTKILAFIIMFCNKFKNHKDFKVVVSAFLKQF